MSTNADLLKGQQISYEDMDLEEVEAVLQKAVYEATRLIEKCEKAGLIYGNGHHIRQGIADYAKSTLRMRWKTD